MSNSTILPQRGIYPKAENAVRIMTFNLLYKGNGEHAMENRTGIAAQTIAEYLPDSLGVQEATPAWMEALTHQLPEYSFVGVGREDGKALGEYTAVFYLTAKYKMIDTDNFWLSDTPQIPSKSWGSNLNRVCTWAVLENLITGERYAHINTHLDNRGEPECKKGIDMLLEKAAGFQMPVVCTGDFNLKENSGFYKYLMNGVLLDTKFASPDTMNHPTSHGFDLSAHGDDIIDYILVNKRLNPLVYRVVTEGINGKPVSDHYPVYSDLTFN